MAKFHRESGQTLYIGVIMLLALCLTVLIVFDVHNATRAKLKVETAQQAAALAAADWQKESLNLIGEINLIKACSTLLEGETGWQSGLPSVAGKNGAENRRAALQARLDHLTEMQSRVSFLGPLLGFAAAQQAAKANGLPSQSALEKYVSKLRTDNRYTGAPQTVGNYRWLAPYSDLLETIASGGIAVFPNGRMAGGPAVAPEELKYENFYAAIEKLRDIIPSEGDVIPYNKQQSWETLRKFVMPSQGYPFEDGDYDGKWWDIDYSFTNFPNESEVYTLGVRDGFHSVSDYSSYDDNGREIYKRLTDFAAVGEVYRDATQLPGNMHWSCYDEQWYPKYFEDRRGDDYSENHYYYWFVKSKDTPLRHDVKPCYRYEGPAAYAEGYVLLGRTSLFCATCANHTKLLKLSPERNYFVGSRRFSNVDKEDTSGDYRPGAIAKPLGAFDHDTPPTVVPLILPVFTEAAVMPTYMPVPFGFSVLSDDLTTLDEFLAWLSGKAGLKESATPPSDSYYLELLLLLCDGKNFRYYGFNPKFNESGFDSKWRKKLNDWQDSYDQEAYSAAKNTAGPGWFQMPRLCYDATYTNVSKEGSSVQVTDHLNGGTATRVYLPGSRNYYVVNSSGHIVNNSEMNPTILYNDSDAGGSGGYAPRRGVDTSKGPRRL